MLNILALQLKKLIKEEVIFVDFQEGALTFPPTYKYDFGTDTYDTRLVAANCIEIPNAKYFR